MLIIDYLHKYQKTYLLISFLLILILPPILFTQRQQLIKLFNSIRFHLPGIQQFAVELDEVQRQMFFNAVFGWILMILLNEAFHLIVSYQPSFVLGHNR